MHVPNRPAWTCQECGTQWPCEAAQTTLRVEYGTEPVSVGLYLASQYAAASRDMPNQPAGDLYLRFFGWVR